VSDTFVTEDGRRVHGEFFTHLFYGEEWVEKFQVVQESERLITISVVPSDPTLEPEASYRDQMDKIRGDIHAAMGEECEVQFEFREEIPPSESGKYRYTISKVEHERA
jgi:phenylacetate-CoA ligase